jgi:hypothetical protein
MRVERALVGLLYVVAAAVAGCGGELAYNLPPAARLMEPGPGVGGPGPGVIPPASNPYGMYGGAVGRYGDGMGGYIGGGYGGGYGECASCPPAAASQQATPSANSGVQQASYEGAQQAQYDDYYGDDYGYVGGTGSYGCGDEVGMGAPCADGGCGNCGCGAGGNCGCGAGGCGAGGCVNGCAGCGGGFGHGHGLLGRLLHGHGRWGGPGSTEACADGSAMAGMATSQVAFLGADGVQVNWDVSGYGLFDSTTLVIPGRQDFYQGAIYRLKLTNIPGRPGVELYPTLEIAPVTPRTDAYLAHSPIPVQFTEEDFDQVLSGNFVTKVIYLPDPEFQELALAGVETLVSTRLDPGVDPIAEADRRGSILAILRMGNKDLEPGYGASYTPADVVVPAGHVTTASGTSDNSYATQAVYEQPAATTGSHADESVTPAQYGQPCGPAYGYGAYGDGGAGMMPMGMPTSGFAPPAMPPNMVAGAPQWGMPITGTPIGLPGPPHIPLGTPAGLQKHTMRNHTRVLMPPPVDHVKVSVKHRPGLNYPRPVNHVHLNETQREPLRLMPNWFSHLFHHNGGGLFGRHAGAGAGAYGDPNCQ